MRTQGELRRSWRRAIQKGECVANDLRNWCPGVRHSDIDTFLAGGIVRQGAAIALERAWLAFEGGRLPKREPEPELLPRTAGRESLSAFIAVNEPIVTQWGVESQQSWRRLRMLLKVAWRAPHWWECFGVDLPAKLNTVVQLEVVTLQVRWATAKFIARAEAREALAQERSEVFLNDALRENTWMFILGSRRERREARTQAQATA